MKKRTKVILAVLSLLLITGTVWAFMGQSQMQKVQEMQKDLFSEGRPDREKFEQFRQEVDKLTPAQRNELLKNSGFGQRELKKAADYCNMPQDQRLAYLDQQIQEEEKWQKEREARRNQQGPNAAGPGPNAGGPGPNAGGQGGGQAGGRSAEQRSERRNQMLDRMSPTQRAQMVVFRQAMAQRRAQLGLPPQRGGRGRW